MPQNTAFHTEIPCGTQGIPNVLNGALDVLNQDYWKKILLMFRIILKEQRAVALITEDSTETRKNFITRGLVTTVQFINYVYNTDKICVKNMFHRTPYTWYNRCDSYHVYNWYKRRGSYHAHS